MDAARPRLAVIELVERDGRARRLVEVRHWPLTIGRALDCDVVLDDPHVAAHHLRIAPADDGTLWLEVGATRNGVRLGPRTLIEGERCPLPPAGTVWQLGGTRLRLRLPSDPVEPERPLGLAATGARMSVTLGCALALWALVLAEHAIALDPGSSLTDWLLPLLAWPVAAFAWCALWALASRLLQHRFELWAHFALLVKGLLAIALLYIVLPIVAFALSWEWLSRITPVVCAAVAAGVLYRHATLALPMRRWIIGGAIGASLAVAAAIGATLDLQRTDRWFPEPYLATLAPPVFRLAPGVPVRQFVDGATEVRERVDRRSGLDPAPERAESARH
jgi:hypothetical protein